MGDIAPLRDIQILAHSHFSRITNITQIDKIIGVAGVIHSPMTISKEWPETVEKLYTYLQNSRLKHFST